MKNAQVFNRFQRQNKRKNRLSAVKGIHRPSDQSLERLVNDAIELCEYHSIFGDHLFCAQGARHGDVRQRVSN